MDQGASPANHLSQAGDRCQALDPLDPTLNTRCANECAAQPVFPCSLGGGAKATCNTPDIIEASECLKNWWDRGLIMQQGDGAVSAEDYESDL